MIKKVIELIYIDDEFFIFPVIRKIRNKEEYKRLFGNFFYLSLLQGANYVFPLISLPYLVRVIGMEKFGLLAFATATIGYFQILTDYGFNLSATREISINRNDKEKVDEIFSSVMIIKFGLMALSLVLLTILLFLFDKFGKDKIIYYSTFGVVVGQVLFPVWFFQGMEQMKYITYLNVFSRFLFTIAVFVFVQNQADYRVVPILTSMGGIIAGFSSLMVIKKNFQVEFKCQRVETIKRYLKEAHHIFIPNMAMSLYTTSNAFILGLFTNNAIVGCFSATERVVAALQGILSPIYQSLYPYVSRLKSISSADAIHLIKRILNILVPVLIVVTLVIAVNSKRIILFLYGDEIAGFSFVLTVLIFKFLFVGIAYIYANLFLLAFGYIKLWKKIILLASGAGIMLSMIFVGVLKMGIAGQSISILVTEFLVLTMSFKSYLKYKKEAVL